MKTLHKIKYLFISLVVISNSLIPLVSSSNTDPYFSGPFKPSQDSNTPTANPVVLLVGISNGELTYRELSSFTGFEFFTVPYGTDIMALTQRIQPSQIIIRHPSGFTGLYTVNGQLVRGVETTIANEYQIAGTNPSIIKPADANTSYRRMQYPGGATGSVPHGGLGYVPPKSGTNSSRNHFAMIVTNSAVVPFQYPGYFRNLNVLDGEANLFRFLLSPIAPAIVLTAANYVQAMSEQKGYDEAITQPRDYMFQPELEGY